MADRPVTGLPLALTIVVGAGVVPKSHLGMPASPQGDERWVEQVEGGEPTVALALNAGDLVMTHDELLHTGGNPHDDL